MTKSPGALDGIRILDMSRILAGPYCTMLLGDYGAEVIKIEAPGRGDDTRQWGPPWAEGESAYFLTTNRNKKSLTLDLKHIEGQKILRQLAKDSDVLIDNFKFGTMQRLGIDYESLKSINPGLICCSISGYGQKGPYKDLPGYDFVIQAQGGFMSITGPRDGAPHKVGVAIIDLAAGLFASSAILAALRHREKTGQGQFIDVSLLDTQVALLANVAQNYLVSGEATERYGNAHPNIVPYEVFPSADGFIAIGIGNDSQYERFCRVAACMPLWEEEKYQTNPGRVENRSELVPKLQAVFKSRKTSEWVKLLQSELIPVGPINSVSEIMNDAHLLERDMVQTITHPTIGPLKQIGHAAKLSETPAHIQSPPPLLGQHNNSVLQELLGFTKEKVNELKTQKII